VFPTERPGPGTGHWHGSLSNGHLRQGFDLRQLVLFWVSASRLLLCGMGVEQTKLIPLHGFRPYRLSIPCPWSRGGAHFVS
jgi:hypothetical protein